MTARTAGRLQNFFHDAYAPDEYRMLARTVSHECFRILKPDRACYVFMNWRSLGVWLDSLAAAGFRLKNVIVWDKVLAGLNYQNYAHTFELLIFAIKGRFMPRNKGRGEDHARDLWHIRRETRHHSHADFHHETVKPEPLVRRPIEHASLRGEVVLDPFMGSGTTCVVAKRLGRGYIGIELDPWFFALAASRLAAAQEGFASRDGCAASSRPKPAMRRKSVARSKNTKRSE